jgi:hypothetical protein
VHDWPLCCDDVCLPACQHACICVCKQNAFHRHCNRVHMTTVHVAHITGTAPYKLEVRTSVHGPTIANATVRSADDCATACTAFQGGKSHSRCSAWTWWPEHANPPSSCKLKSTRGNVVQAVHADMVSGYLEGAQGRGRCRCGACSGCGSTTVTRSSADHYGLLTTSMHFASMHNHACLRTPTGAYFVQQQAWSVQMRSKFA